METYWVIRCSVSGGITGNRTSTVKREGEVIRFDSEDAAKIEANRLENKMNGPFAKAYFNYWVEQQ